MSVTVHLVYRGEVSVVVEAQVEVQGVYVQVVTEEPQQLLQMTSWSLY